MQSTRYIILTFTRGKVWICRQWNSFIIDLTVYWKYVSGGIEMVLFVIPACIGLSLLIIIVFAYFGKHERWATTGLLFSCIKARKNNIMKFISVFHRVKMCLWPIIPDPANSSIKRWTTTDSVQVWLSFSSISGIDFDQMALKVKLLTKFVS